jgi:hypothetical protein
MLELSAIALALLCASPFSIDPIAGPFDAPGYPVTVDAEPVGRAVGGVVRPPLSIQGYRLVSRFQGPRCRHRPTCSAFAAEAMDRHGAVLGGWITAARLLRGERSSALRALPRDEAGRFLDPLGASTFFLEGAGR